MTTPHLHTIGLVVRDMAAALAFYRSLGIDIPTSMDTEEHVDVTLPCGVALGFDLESLVRQFDPAWVAPTGQRLNLQFSFATPTDVDATHERLVRAGHASHQAPWDAPWGQRFARVIDPDGSVVNLFAPLHEPEDAS